MRIGLILSHKGTNYGMMLQAFATQAYLDTKGISSEIITVKSELTFKSILKTGIRHLVPTSFFASLRKKKRRRIVASDSIILSAYKKRVDVGKDFISKYLHDIVFYDGYENATKAARNKYDCVLIGSDQQWSPACFYSPLNTLQFVPREVVKASYATSMGVSEIPFYTKKRLRRFIERMDFVSVREETGKKIIQGVCGRRDVDVVADPTLLLTYDDWKQAIPDKIITDEDYIFCYFLGDSTEPINIVNKYAKKYDLRVIAIRNIESYSTEKVDYGEATVLEGPTVDEFLNYIRHAQLVCTDSFHATVFSLINSVAFAVFYRTKPGDKNSRNSRIDDLLGRLNLESRICYGEQTLEEIARQAINYDNVQKLIEESRKHGREFIERIIKESRQRGTIFTNVLEYPLKECCGCGICSLKCPQKILSMKEDAEGFYYPAIRAADECIHCGVCTTNCPVHNRETAQTINFSTPFYAYTPDENECRQSSSGGVAIGLYKAFMRTSGRCYGAAYGKDFSNVVYERANSVDELKKFRGSKYVKTEHASLYLDIENDLRNENKIIVIGLPCDIAALKQYLGGDSEKLYTCEVICHGPTTPIALKSFVEEFEKKEESKLVSLNCRSKRPYWKPYYISAGFENGKEINIPFTGSSLEKAFQAMKRPSCNDCSFKDGSSCSDMIIGDYHGAQQNSNEYNPYGVSICFPITEKGMELLQMLERDGYVIGQANKQRAVANKALTTSLEKLSVRKRFFRILLSSGLTTAANDPIIMLGLRKRRIVMKLRVYKKALLSKIR